MDLYRYIVSEVIAIDAVNSLSNDDVEGHADDVPLSTLNQRYIQALLEYARTRTSSSTGDGGGDGGGGVSKTELLDALKGHPNAAIPAFMSGFTDIDYCPTGDGRAEGAIQVPPIQHMLYTTHGIQHMVYNTCTC